MAGPIRRLISLLRGAALPDPRAVFGAGIFVFNPSVYNLQRRKRKSDQLGAYKGWVAAAVNKIATEARQVPWNLVKRVGPLESDVEIIDRDDIPPALLRPSRNLTFGALVELTSKHLDTVGEAYWYKATEQGGRSRRIIGLQVLYPHWIAEPHYDELLRMFTGWRLQVPSQPEQVIPFEDVIWLYRPHPIEPWRGASPVEQVALTVDLDLYAKAYGTQILEGGGQPPGLLSIEGTRIDEKVAEVIRRRWKEQRQDPDNIAIVGQGAKYQPIGNSLADLQWMDLSRQNRDQILAIYGVPAAKLGLIEDVNRANADAMERSFARDVIRPRLRLIEEAINASLPEFGITDPRIQFRFEDPVADNVEVILKAANDALERGAITINEYRSETGRQHIEGGDVFAPRANVRILEKLEPIRPLLEPPRGDGDDGETEEDGESNGRNGSGRRNGRDRDRAEEEERALPVALINIDRSVTNVDARYIDRRQEHHTLVDASFTDRHQVDARQDHRTRVAVDNSLSLVDASVTDQHQVDARQDHRTDVALDNSLSLVDATRTEHHRTEVALDQSVSVVDAARTEHHHTEIAVDESLTVDDHRQTDASVSIVDASQTDNRQEHSTVVDASITDQHQVDARQEHRSEVAVDNSLSLVDATRTEHHRTDVALDHSLSVVDASQEHRHDTQVSVDRSVSLDDRSQTDASVSIVDGSQTVVAPPAEPAVNTEASGATAAAGDATKPEEDATPTPPAPAQGNPLAFLAEPLPKDLIISELQRRGLLPFELPISDTEFRQLAAQFEVVQGELERDWQARLRSLFSAEQSQVVKEIRSRVRRPEITTTAMPYALDGDVWEQIERPGDERTLRLFHTIHFPGDDDDELDEIVHRDLLDRIWANNKASWQKAFSSRIKRGIRAGWELLKRETGRELLSFELVAEIVADFAARAAERKVQQVRATTRRAVAAAIAAFLRIAEADGRQVTNKEIAEEVSRIYDLFKGARTSTIARTESAQAVNGGKARHADEASRRLGLVMRKTWNAILDDRVRDAHEQAHGQRRMLVEKFEVGGELLDRPLDPAGSASNIINCRCSLHFDVVEQPQ